MYEVIFGWALLTAGERVRKQTVCSLTQVRGTGTDRGELASDTSSRDRGGGETG